MNIYTLEVFLIAGPVDEKFIKKNPVISRTIEIRGDQTLESLHDEIFKAFDRFDEHLYEFQVGGKGPNDPKSRRYSIGDETTSKKQTADASKTVINDLKLKKDAMFGYWFDFGDDWWHQINVLSVEPKSPEGEYPRITNRVGKSPPQYMDRDE